MSELELIRESVRRFAREVVAPTLHDLNHYPDLALPPKLLPGLAELGLLEDFADKSLLGAALGELSRVAAAPAALLLTHAFARELVREAGGPRASTLLAKNGGGLFAYPIYAEPGLTDAAPSLRRAGAELELDGVAELVVNAPLAKVLILPVRDLDADGAFALVALDASGPGVVVGAPLLTLGMRGCPTADVSFSRARFPQDRRLGASPSFASAATRRFRGPALALAAGVLESSIQTATEYAQERYQGGCPIIEHQEVRAILGRMLEDLAVCAEAAARVGELPESRSLALFVHAKERVAHATSDGVQLLGGNGYMEDYPQERAMRDAKQAQYLFGRTDHARQEAVAAHLTEGARP